MIHDTQHHMIVHAGFGSYEVLPCTVENAYRIFSSKLIDMPASLRDLAEKIKLAREEKNKTFKLIEDAQEALLSLYDAQCGDQLPKMHRYIHGKKPQFGESFFEARQKDQDALAIWLQRNRINLKAFDAEGALKMEDLPFMAPMYSRLAGKEVIFVREDNYDEAEELFIIQKNSWLEEASELRVVIRILEFANSYSHRDEKFHVADLKEIF